MGCAGDGGGCLRYEMRWECWKEVGSEKHSNVVEIVRRIEKREGMRFRDGVLKGKTWAAMKPSHPLCANTNYGCGRSCYWKLPVLHLRRALYRIPQTRHA